MVIWKILKEKQLYQKSSPNHFQMCRVWSQFENLLFFKTSKNKNGWSSHELSLAKCSTNLFSKISQFFDWWTMDTLISSKNVHQR
jgi:hypothetical protein